MKFRLRLFLTLIMHVTMATADHQSNVDVATGLTTCNITIRLKRENFNKSRETSSPEWLRIAKFISTLLLQQPWHCRASLPRTLSIRLRHAETCWSVTIASSCELLLSQRPRYIDLVLLCHECAVCGVSISFSQNFGERFDGGSLTKEKRTLDAFWPLFLQKCNRC